MTTDAAPDQRSTTQPRRAYRSERAMVGGVCAGLAAHLGWPVTIIRVTFAVLTNWHFAGLFLYAAFWMFLPREPGGATTPGLDAAGRAGMRGSTAPERPRDSGSRAALAAVGIGVVWLIQASGRGVSSALFWPLVFAWAGVVLVWNQWDVPDEASESRPTDPAWVRPLLRRGGWPAVLRSGSGLMLVGASVSMVAASHIGLSELPTMIAMTGLTLLGVGTVAAPWLYRMRTRLAQAQEARILADARADMAAHLHDSVLQTLALIQRQASDPKAVATLARRQERELRTWLYGETDDDETLKAAITRAAAEIEAERGVPVEVVCVGDAELTGDLAAMVRAAREAMMNAAKHSGANSIDVYAEIDAPIVEIFVRDRGTGFALADVADDRMGVRGSIIGRMERHGGRATIKSAPDGGTEIRLEMTL